jgi:hypothetical protein
MPGSELVRLAAGELIVFKRLTRITCRHAHELLSQRMDTPLPLPARIKLELHLRACSWCSRIDRQMDFMRQAMRRLGE